MNYKNLLFILLLLTAIACNSPKEDKKTQSKVEEKKSAPVETDKLDNKVGLEDALKDLKGDDKATAKWLFENYKGRIDQVKVTQALSEMGVLATNFIYGDLDETEIDGSINTYCEQYKDEIDVSHFKAKHACMHGFSGADETNPYFLEFEFIGKTEKGDYAFNCTITAENIEEGNEEKKYVEVKKEDNGFAISMIRCRASI